MDELSNQVPLQDQYVLNPLQKELHDTLASKNPNLASMYFGGLSALNTPANPERYSQCAQSFRELMEKLWIEYDPSWKSKGPSLKTKAKTLQKAYRKIRWKHGKVVAAGQMSTTSLDGFCCELDQFFEWNNKFLPDRKEQTSRLLAKMDPLTGKLPTKIMELRVQEYTYLREYFEDVAHHNRAVANDAEFQPYVKALENFLMERLKPRTAASFSQIQRLIEEGERNG